MELVERKTDFDKIEDLTNKQKENLFCSIVRGQDAIETIETSRGKFKIKFPRMKDIEAIGRLVAYRLNGLDAKCFDEVTYSLIQEIATLDVLVVEGPDWYENAKKENKFGLSWGDMPSQSFVQEVYAKAYDFRFEMQKKLEQFEEKESVGVDSGKNDTDINGAGLFEGMSSN
jgi:hypothetical protein